MFLHSNYTQHATSNPASESSSWASSDSNPHLFGGLWTAQEPLVAANTVSTVHKHLHDTLTSTSANGTKRTFTTPPTCREWSRFGFLDPIASLWLQWIPETWRNGQSMWVSFWILLFTHKFTDSDLLQNPSVPSERVGQSVASWSRLGKSFATRTTCTCAHVHWHSARYLTVVRAHSVLSTSLCWRLDSTSWVLSLHARTFGVVVWSGVLALLVLLLLFLLLL